MMLKVILLAILFNSQTGEIEQVKVGGFEDYAACEAQRKVIAEEFKKFSGIEQIYLRCLTPFEQAT